MRKILALSTALMALCCAACASYITLGVLGSISPEPIRIVSAEIPAAAVIAVTPVADEKAVYRNILGTNRAALDSELDKIAAKYGVVGMSVAAFEHDRIVYRHCAGLQNIEKSIPATNKTKYRVASISKMVTAMLAVMLEERTDFSIDDDLRQIIAPIRSPYYPDMPVTTRQLIMHTSGLTDGIPYNDAIIKMQFPPLKSLMGSSDMWLNNKPGTRYEYSNFGAGAVSAVIETETGMRFYDYAKKALFDPLGVDASYSIHLINDKSLLANIYNQNRELQAEPEQWNNMDQIYGSIPLGEMYMLGHGDLFISAEDLARIGIILAGDGTYRRTQYISEQSLAQMNCVALTDTSSGVSRGLGTFAMTNILQGSTVYGHQGNAYGMISGIFYDPITETGVVFLSNGCNLSKGSQGLYDVNREIMSEVWRYLAPES